jgi:Domain of unknown function (DUF4760)
MLNYITGIGAVVSLLLGVLTLFLDHRRRKRQATLEVYIQAGEYRQEVFNEQREVKHGNRTQDGALTAQEAMDIAYESSSGHDAVRNYLSYWEHVAVGVKRRVYDRKVLKDLSRRVICRGYERYALYICFIRLKNEHPEAYKAFENLAVGYGSARVSCSQYKQQFEARRTATGMDRE